MAAVLIKKFGVNKLDLIMDAIQDTFETALLKWRYSGFPDNPNAWLMTVAKNNLINSLRKREKGYSLANEQFTDNFVMESADRIFSEKEIKDDQLRLLLMCCRIPQTSVKNKVIVTLYLLSGFGVPEIASGMLMSEEAVKKALSRTKELLRNSKVSSDGINADAILNQLNAVHYVLYLLFNEGHTATSSREGIKKDLCYEALRLANLVLAHYPNEPVTNALAALMCFNIARFPARLTSAGDWIELKRQDRTLWNSALISEGVRLLNIATRSQTMSRYHLEAMINSIHCLAPSFEKTDWKKINYLYQRLEYLEPDSLLIKLNKIISESFLEPSQRLIDELTKLENDFPDEKKYLLFAAKGDLFDRLRKVKEAESAYSLAIEYARSKIDVKLLTSKINRLPSNDQ